jgi:hypothetical protein
MRAKNAEREHVKCGSPQTPTINRLSKNGLFSLHSRFLYISAPKKIMFDPKFISKAVRNSCRYGGRLPKREALLTSGQKSNGGRT